MKKRMFALALAVCLLGSLLVRVSAAEESAIPGSWSADKFWRSGRFTYPYVFDETLIDCTGFTMDYEITQVATGSVDGNFVFEVYLCDPQDNWHSVTNFALEDQKITVEVALKNPMSIKAVAVVCQKKANITYSHALTVRDVQFRGTASGAYARNLVRGSWGREAFSQDNRAAVPYVFDQVQKNCGGFTLLYEICQITEGSLTGPVPYQVYARSGGSWQMVQEFTMTGTSMAVDVAFSPMDVEAVAVFCMKNADLTYACQMAVTDPVTE